MPILSNNNKILSNRDNSGEWRRPEDWLPMPTDITSADEIFVGLHAVIENNDNFVAFLFTTSTGGQYQVDWGDGTVTLHNSNTAAEYQYDFATYDVNNITLCSRGYKQAMITVTPVTGVFRICNFQRRYTTIPSQNLSYSTGFLDCILSMPNASTSQSITLGGTIVRHAYVEKFDIKTIGDVTLLPNLFFRFTSLQSVPLFNTQNVTNMGSMFSECLFIQSVPLFNTQNVTNMNSMFSSTGQLKSVPLFNTSKVTSMDSMFQFSAIELVPLFDTQNVTGMSSMFNSSFIKSVPLFNTSKVTSMNSMFNGCSRLKSLPLFDTSNVTDMYRFARIANIEQFPLLDTSKVQNMAEMFNNCFMLNSIPPLSTQSITTTSGTDFGALFTQDSQSLNRCQMSFSRNVSLIRNQLSRDALVEIFTNLVDRSATTSANINITGNWGATALSTEDRDIALNKNWTITG
jgi:surface protein